MNPLLWRREHQVAGLSFCVAGGLFGLLFAWLNSQFYRICQLPAGFAGCSDMFMMWLQHPAQYWLFTICGAAIPGLLFYGFQLSRQRP